jgi:hypothetical protein
MSLIVSVFINGAIVMASDSRASMSRTMVNGNQTIVDNFIHYNDNTMKTYLCPNNCGISVCGNATIEGSPISGCIDSFIKECIHDSTDIDEMPKLILEYFHRFKISSATIIHICGFHNNGGSFEKRVYKIELMKQSVQVDGKEKCGVFWDGEVDVLTKLIKSTILPFDNTNVYNVDNVKVDDKNIDHAYIIDRDKSVVLKEMQMPIDQFTIQDAIDFAVYAIKTTAETMRFQLTAKTVGGPIDVLVLKPSEALWVKKKELKVE